MKLYKATLYVDPEGLTVFYREFIPVHESKCFYWCITSIDKLRTLNQDYKKAKSKLKWLKDKGVEVKRVHKESSRFAFVKKEDALSDLRRRKKKQILHLKRDLAIAEFFVNSDVGHDDIVIGSLELVKEFYF